MKNKDIPDSTIIKCLIRDNRCLIAEIKQLEKHIEVCKKEIKDSNKKYTQKCQEFSNWKAQTKNFYEGITKEEGISELLKETKAYKKEEIKRLRTEVEQLRYTVGKYARILQEHNLLYKINESETI